MTRSGKKNQRKAYQKRTKYETALRKYGILSLLYVLKEFEDTERFEECQQIYNAIVETNKRDEINFPTRYGTTAIEYIKSAFKEHGLQGVDYYLEDIRYYANETMLFIKQQK